MVGVSQSSMISCEGSQFQTTSKTPDSFILIRGSYSNLNGLSRWFNVKYLSSEFEATATACFSSSTPGLALAKAVEWSESLDFWTTFFVSDCKDVEISDFFPTFMVRNCSDPFKLSTSDASFGRRSNGRRQRVDCSILRNSFHLVTLSQFAVFSGFPVPLFGVGVAIYINFDIK